MQLINTDKTMKTVFLLTFILIASVLQAQDLPPWRIDVPLSAEEVPPVYLTEWGKADNADGCAPLILFGAEREQGIQLRRANFHGGWAVAYDTPTQRSSFGIAGAGVLAGGNAYNFPHKISWSDGSYASYGLEGGIGPNYLAYLTVAGQSCLYNVWSARGKEHLELLLNSIRMVNTLTVKPDITAIANALAAQVPEINAEYRYKDMYDDTSDEVLKHYLYYFNEGTDLSEGTGRDWITALKMYWYKRPAEANDIVLVSYFDGSVQGFQPWLKCFRFDRKTGVLTAADLPFTIRRREFAIENDRRREFSTRANQTPDVENDTAMWRMDYKIGSNGNVVISASPDMATKYVAIVRWDKQTGFTVYKRGRYNSRITIADDNAETENYTQTVIRPNFQRINATNKWAWIEKKESWELSLEGALLTYYYSAAGLEKIVAELFGESYKAVIECYFLDGQLSFIYEKTQKYTKSPYEDDDFDPDKDFTLEERRWYIKDDACFRGIGNDGKRLTPAEMEEEFLGDESNLGAYQFYKLILAY